MAPKRARREPTNEGQANPNAQMAMQEGEAAQAGNVPDAMLTKAQYLEWARRRLSPKHAEKSHKVDLEALVDELPVRLARDAVVYICQP